MNITATLLGQMVAFALLIWFVNKLLWGPLNNLLTERQKKIADGLAAGEKGKHELELAEKRAREELQTAKGQAAEILTQAEKRGSEIVEEAKTDARSEGERILTAAQAEIQQESNRAREQLRGQVASIAAAAAGKILASEIDEKKHADLIKELVEQI